MSSRPSYEELTEKYVSLQHKYDDLKLTHDILIVQHAELHIKYVLPVADQHSEAVSDSDLVELGLKNSPVLSLNSEHEQQQDSVQEELAEQMLSHLLASSEIELKELENFNPQIKKDLSMLTKEHDLFWNNSPLPKPQPQSQSQSQDNQPTPKLVLPGESSPSPSDLPSSDLPETTVEPRPVETLTVSEAKDKETPPAVDASKSPHSTIPHLSPSSPHKAAPGLSDLKHTDDIQNISKDPLSAKTLPDPSPELEKQLVELRDRNVELNGLYSDLSGRHDGLGATHKEALRRQTQLLKLTKDLTERMAHRFDEQKHLKISYLDLKKQNYGMKKSAKQLSRMLKEIFRLEGIKCSPVLSNRAVSRITTPDKEGHTKKENEIFLNNLFPALKQLIQLTRKRTQDKANNQNNPHTPRKSQFDPSYAGSLDSPQTPHVNDVSVGSESACADESLRNVLVMAEREVQALQREFHIISQKSQESHNLVSQSPVSLRTERGTIRHKQQRSEQTQQDRDNNPNKPNGPGQLNPVATAGVFESTGQLNDPSDTQATPKPQTNNPHNFNNSSSSPSHDHASASVASPPSASAPIQPVEPPNAPESPKTEERERGQHEAHRPRALAIRGIGAAEGVLLSPSEHNNHPNTSSSSSPATPAPSSRGISGETEEREGLSSLSTPMESTPPSPAVLTAAGTPSGTAIYADAAARERSELTAALSLEVSRAEASSVEFSNRLRSHSPSLLLYVCLCVCVCVFV